MVRRSNGSNRNGYSNENPDKISGFGKPLFAEFETKLDLPEKASEHDIEVPTSAAEGPEEIFILRDTGGEYFTVRGDYLAGQQIVDGHAVLAKQPANTTPEGETPNTCLRHYPGWDCETEWVRFPVEIAKRRATLDAYGACGRVHMDGAHAREINDNAIVAKGTAADIVASASNCREQIVVAREVDGGDDVGDT